MTEIRIVEMEGTPETGFVPQRTAENFLVITPPPLEGQSTETTEGAIDETLAAELSEDFFAALGSILGKGCDDLSEDPDSRIFRDPVSVIPEMDTEVVN